MMMLGTEVDNHYLLRHSLSNSRVLDSPTYGLNDGLGLGLGLTQGLGPVQLQLQGDVSQDFHLRFYLGFSWTLPENSPPISSPERFSSKF